MWRKLTKTQVLRARTVTCVMALLVLQACNSGDLTAPAHTTLPPAPELPLTSASAAFTSVEPEVAVAGSSLFIRGQNLNTSGSQIAVTLGETALPVVSKTSTVIEVRVPENAFACQPTTFLELRVSAGSAQLARSIALRTATPVVLPAGGSAHIAAGSNCIELLSDSAAIASTSSSTSNSNSQPAPASGARFVLALVNSDTVAQRRSLISVRGQGGPNARFSAGSIDGLRVNANAPSSAFARSPLQNNQLEESNEHARFLARNAQLAAPAPAPAPAGAIAASYQASTLPTPKPNLLRSSRKAGDMVSMSALYNSCAKGVSVAARVVYAGERVVILEDVASPRASQMDDQYIAIGQEFDRVVYPLLVSSVGDPLAMSRAMGTATNADSRVNILVTSFVNDSAPGTAAYVSVCNFQPRNVFAASNEAAIIYLRASTMYETPAEWRRVMRSTVVHEAKHLASFAERLWRGLQYEEPWLEEATARIAEELYARQFTGGGSWRGGTGFTSSLGCELTQCDDRPLVMWKHFSQLYNYLRNTDALSPLAPSSNTDATWYASGWSLVRFVLDRYAGDEASTLKALVRGDAGSGLGSLTSLSRQPVQTLLADWAIYNTGLTNPMVRSSWNMESIWSGLSSLLAGAYDALPLKATQYPAGSDFEYSRQVVSGGVAYLVVEGSRPGVSQVLKLESSASTNSVRPSIAVARLW